MSSGHPTISDEIYVAAQKICAGLRTLEEKTGLEINPRLQVRDDNLSILTSVLSRPDIRKGSLNTYVIDFNQRKANHSGPKDLGTVTVRIGKEELFSCPASNVDRVFNPRRLSRIAKVLRLHKQATL